MADDRHDHAIDTVARHLVATAVANSVPDVRFEYPDVGEYDWQQIVAHADTLAVFPHPVTYDAAYEYLARRAQGQEPTP